MEGSRLWFSQEATKEMETFLHVHVTKAFFFFWKYLVCVCCAAETESKVKGSAFFSLEEEPCAIGSEVIYLTHHWAAVHAGRMNSSHTL